MGLDAPPPHSSLPWGGIVLSAGRSRRMGSHKALVSLAGRPLLGWALDALAILDHLVVVCSHDTIERFTPMCRGSGATPVVNPDPSRGPLSSIQTGLEALPPDLAGVVLLPVDVPVQSATVAALVGAVTSSPGPSIAIASYQGRAGHPVALGGSLVPSLSVADPLVETLRTFIKRPDNATIEVPLDDPGVTANINTPEALRLMEALLGER